VADEKAVPSKLGDDPDIETIVGIGAGIEILYEEFAALDMGAHIGQQDIEVPRRHRGVVFPPDRAFHRRLAHHELVLGRTAGVLAGADEQGTALTEITFAPDDCLLDQRGLQEVVMHMLDAGETGLRQCRAGTGFCHRLERHRHTRNFPQNAAESQTAPASETLAIGANAFAVAASAPGTLYSTDASVSRPHISLMEFRRRKNAPRLFHAVEMGVRLRSLWPEGKYRNAASSGRSK